jgi:hypothetical protein
MRPSRRRGEENRKEKKIDHTSDNPENGVIVMMIVDARPWLGVTPSITVLTTILR